MTARSVEKLDDPRGRVLVVDDDEGARYVLSRTLRAAGYAVEEADCAATALAVAPSVDVVLLDVKLPDVSGVEVCRRLKRDPRTAHVVVLQVSAVKTSPDDRALGLEEGADGYLVKPIDPRELTATVAALLRPRPPRDFTLTARDEFLDRIVAASTLAAGVGHEITTPLTLLVSSLEQLGAMITDDAARAVLSDARDAAHRIAVIARDLRGLTRPADDAATVLDIHQPLDRAIHLTAGEVRYRGRIVQNYRARGRVRASDTRVGQLFVNLLMNAAQALPERQAESSEITVETFDRDGMVVVEITDTGCGIPEEHRAKLFEPFFTTKRAGTGLGLPICHRIVTSLGGAIEVESDVHRGTRVRVRLPATLERARTTEVPPSEVPPAPRRVLIVDDEKAVTRVMSRALQGRDACEVVAHHDARDALAAIRSGDRFDVIFCDLMMPEMTGADFYDELARVAPEQAARVVVMTGGAFTRATREFTDKMGARKLEKPFTAAAVRRAMNEVTARVG